MRKNKQGGFTLIEMLIVVAIIAILVAVSIPIVGNALERAREATDAANERSAKAEATILYLNEDPIITDNYDATLRYNAVTGKIQTDTTDITGYGKCSLHKGYMVCVKVSKDGTVDVFWNNGKNDAHNGVVASATD